MVNLRSRLHVVETRVMRWLVLRSITVLRVSLGAVFLAFGFLKFFPGLSPAAELAVKTMGVLTFGLIPDFVGLLIIATLECVIGIGLISGRFLRLTLLLLGAQMVGAMSPLILFTGEMFSGPFYTPRSKARYIIKDVVLISSGFVIGATLHGGRIVTERVRRAEDYRRYVPANRRTERPTDRKPEKARLRSR